MRIIRAIYHFFRSDIPYGIGNLIKFFPVVWKFRPWDYGFNLELLRHSLRYLLKTLDEHGMEVDETRIPRVEAIKRVIFLLDHHANGDLLSITAETQGWKELWQKTKCRKNLNS